MAREIVLIGGGGHALVVAEAAGLAGTRVLGVYDDAPDPIACRHLRLPRLGTLADTARAATPAILALGDLATRRRLLDDLAHRLRWADPVVHPAAIVHDSASLVPGVYVGPRAIVHSFATIDAHAILNSGSIVEHECRVGTNSHLAPGSILGGRVTIGLDTLVGLGARVLPNLTIGDRATLGGGALVHRHVHSDTTVVGVPAAPIASRVP
jgi:sugar O-acyltransferase (sialic acid O-acetyltransferase NeuD family)